MQANGFPSRTSILTAAARALGSREPDPSVRNPDWAADRLIGPAELALIAEHALGTALDRSFEEAMNDPDIFGFVWLMLVRTRFIDERLDLALRNGATQLVILGAGFDSRAHRYRDLLRGANVIEIDYITTQQYKQQRVAATLNDAPATVTYAPIDFATESLAEVLERSGFDTTRKTYFIAEGLSMYVPEEGLKQTLRTIAQRSAPGSILLLEYLNQGGIDIMTKNPQGLVKNAFDWGEPFVFGVPDGQDREFFAEVGLDLGDSLKMGTPQSLKYTLRSDGTPYGAHLQKVFRERQEAAMKAMDEATRQQVARAAASTGYWLAELTVPAR
jgi:methyltransferase (TIGR00027 family)